MSPAMAAAAFFDRPDWRRELEQLASRARGEFEPDQERAKLITRELADGRALLNERLRTNAVKDVALPWGIAGQATRDALAATGHRTAFAERPGDADLSARATTGMS